MTASALATSLIAETTNALAAAVIKEVLLVFVITMAASIAAQRQHARVLSLGALRPQRRLGRSLSL